jgi:AraC family transcriptional regulator of adaptative response / methylphosphotriester-DNA alkyltransferase methyltransferase
VDNEMWQAIITSDPTYDGKFYYAVKTTGIFCRPSCKSKNPMKEHVMIYTTTEQAEAANFRPCKRCRPDGKRLPDEEWVEQITELLGQRYNQQLTLPIIAELLHASPYHMHRTFKRIMGVTPAEYIHQKRMTAAKKLLSETGLTITEVAMNVGFLNAAHFSTAFQKNTRMTPTEYRNKG